MLLPPPPPPPPVQAQRAWMDRLDGRPATWCALDVAASVVRATAGARRPRRSLAAYPMDADASKAREAVSAVRNRHRRSAADVQASRRESVCLLTHSRALFDSVLQCARCSDSGNSGRPPAPSLPVPRSRRRRRVTLPICAAEQTNVECGSWTLDASTAVVSGGGGSPVASRPRFHYPTAAAAAEQDVRTSGGLVGSRAKAAERRCRNADERSDTGENDDGRTVRFRLAAMRGDARSGAGGGVTAIGDAVATRSSNFAAAALASPPNDLTAFAALREREEPVTMPDGLSLTPRLPDRRAAGRVPVTRMYRDKPSLTREQARKLQLIARLEDRELDSLKTASAASRQQQPPLQPLPISDDDESELSSDRSQAGSRMETMKERHWVDDVTVSSGSEHCARDESATAIGTAGAEAADSEVNAYRLPPCVCPSSEQKSRLYCVKKWLVKTNFDKCSKAIPLL